MNAPTTGAPELRDASAMLAELNRRGVVLRANGDRLAIDAPRGSIGDLLPELQRFKPALLELLASSAATGDETATAPNVASAIAPDVMPDLSPEAGAALLAKYRRGGAVLSLARNGGALSICAEVPSRFSPAKCERAFDAIERDGLAIFRALELEADASAAREVTE